MRGTLIDKKLISVILIVAFTAVSCTAYKVVTPPRPPRDEDIHAGHIHAGRSAIESQRRVQEGDTIRVVTTDGRNLKFKVIAVTSDAIVGENQHILFSVL